MAMRPNDRIHGKTRGTADEAKKRAQNTPGVKRLADLVDYIDEVYRLCPMTNLPGGSLDASILIAQGSHETGKWGAIRQPGIPSYWERDLNPAAIGIWKDGVPSPFSIKTGKQAAQLHVYEMLIHLHGDVRHPELEEIREVDAVHRDRVLALYATGKYPVIKVIDDLNIRWGPNGRECSWACDPDYQDKLVAHGRWLWPNLQDVEGPQTPPYNWDPIPYPPAVQMIVPKPRDIGYTTVPSRQNVGLCRHATAGGGDIWGIHHYFTGRDDPTGLRRLTDWVVDRRGQIGMLNNPRGTRAPWANGGKGGLRGDGAAFVRRFGHSAVNSILQSIEHVATTAQGPTDAQFEASARLQAAIHQDARTPWDQYPYNPKYGCAVDMEHWEFQTETECPFVLRDWTRRWQARVRGLLKAKQTEVSRIDAFVHDLPPAIDTPLNPAVVGEGLGYPEGMDEDTATRLFGSLVRLNPDGSSETIGFDPQDAISNTWLQRGTRKQEFPAARHWFMAADDPANPAMIADIVGFSNGWILGRANAEDASWQWLSASPVSEALADEPDHPTNGIRVD
jgi:hypothetical protein